MFITPYDLNPSIRLWDLDSMIDLDSLFILSFGATKRSWCEVFLNYCIGNTFCCCTVSLAAESGFIKLSVAAVSCASHNHRPRHTLHQKRSHTYKCCFSAQLIVTLTAKCLLMLGSQPVALAVIRAWPEKHQQVMRNNTKYCKGMKKYFEDTQK